MNKHPLFRTARILIVSWALAGQGIAQIYDANSAYLANELNPATETNSSFGPFSVGYGLNFGDFTAFTAGDHDNFFAGSPITQGFSINNNAVIPAVVVNVGTSPGFAGVAPGEILGHAGGLTLNGFEAPFYNGITRFTAPAAGLYTVLGNFRSLDGGFTQNDILLNSASLITIGNEGAFRFTLQLAANDVVDFSVGAGGDGIGRDSTGLTVSLTAGLPAAQVVNIDFEGVRPGDAASAGVYAGVSAVGIGPVFNGLIADSTGGNDNLTVSGTGLLNEKGQATTIGFTIAPVGGDHEPGQPFAPASLFDDYIFNNSAGNSSPTGSPFTINGLGDVGTTDVYFYLTGFNSGSITLENFAAGGVVGNYNGVLAMAFLGVPVVNGNVNGVFSANGGTGVLGGLSILTSSGMNFWDVDASGTWSTGSNWTSNAAANAVGAFAAFGGGGTAITAPILVTVDGTFTVGGLSFNDASNAYTLAAGAGANITLDNGGAGSFVTAAAGSHTIQSPLTLTARGATFIVTGEADVLTVSGSIGGSVTVITKFGDGTLALSNAANSYAGDTAITQGTLRLGASEVIPHGAGKGGVTLGLGATLDLAGFSETINHLSGQGTITTSAALGTEKLTVGDATNSRFGGTITGPLEIEKVGPGALTLDGTFSFQKLTTNGGLTKVNSALGNGITTVNANASTTFTKSQSLVALNIGNGAVVTLFAPVMPKVVNIDLNGQRDGEASPGTYVGLGAFGTGTVFNGVLVDSNTPAPNNDTLTISATHLLDDSGVTTDITFELANVGGDTAGPGLLTGDYAFNNSAGNSSPDGSPLTIGGLESTTADIYLFLVVGSAGTTIEGQLGTPLNFVNGIANVYFYDDVPVTDGNIHGIFSAGATGVLNGLSIVENLETATLAPAAVPEPGAMTLLIGSVTVFLGLRRRIA